MMVCRTGRSNVRNGLTEHPDTLAGSFECLTERQMRAYQQQLQSAINCSEDGAYAQIHLTTARKIIEIIKDARHAQWNSEEK